MCPQGIYGVIEASEDGCWGCLEHAHCEAGRARGGVTCPAEDTVMELLELDRLYECVVELLPDFYGAVVFKLHLIQEVGGICAEIRG